MRDRLGLIGVHSPLWPNFGMLLPTLRFCALPRQSSHWQGDYFRELWGFTSIHSVIYKRCSRKPCVADATQRVHRTWKSLSCCTLRMHWRLCTLQMMSRSRPFVGSR